MTDGFYLAVEPRHPGDARIALMTNGSAARLGGILEVSFPRPRDRAAVVEHPDYYVLRERLIGFLEQHAASKAA